MVEFKVFDLVECILAYPTLVRPSWGRTMKEIISLERDKIKLKGNG
jgi:hypothetical protein